MSGYYRGVFPVAPTIFNEQGELDLIAYSIRGGISANIFRVMRPFRLAARSVLVSDF